MTAAWRARLGGDGPGQLGIGVCIALVACLYAGPFLSIGLRLGGSGLVPLLDADTYLYAVLARLPVDGQGLATNPWYGQTVPADEVEYLRFGRVISLYALVEGLLGPRFALAAWTTAFAGVMAALAYAVARRAFGLTRTGAAAAVLLIMVFDPRYLASDLRALLSGLDPARFHAGLVYRRPFFPQAGVVVALAYVALAARAMPSGSPRAYAALGAVQFAGVLAFPYATLLCAGATALAGVSMWAVRHPFPKRPLLLFGLACAALDLAYFALSGPAVPDLGSGEGRLWRWDPNWFALTDLRLPLALLALAAILARRAPAPARHVALGFAAMIPLCAWSDVWFATLQIGHHAKYLLPLGTAFSAILLAQESAHRLARLPWRGLALAFLGLAFAWALVQSVASYRVWRPVNDDNRLLYETLREMKLGRGDLVVEPVPAFLSARRPVLYWESSPLPLVSEARVLLTSGARFLLRAEDLAVHLDRLALYLHLAGHDAGSLRAMLAAPALTYEQYFLAGYGREFSLMGGHRSAVLREVLGELEPRLRRLDERPGVLAPATARVVLVVDSALQPTFRRERVEAIFKCEEPRALGPWSMRTCAPP